VLVWDDVTGEPLSDVVVWQDRRAEAIVAELSRDLQAIAERTGLVLDSYFSAALLAQSGIRPGDPATCRCCARCVAASWCDPAGAPGALSRRPG